MPDLTITEFDASDDAAINAGYDVAAARRATQTPDLPPPCRYRHFVEMVQPLPGTTHWRFLAHVGDAVAGWLDVATDAAEDAVVVDLDAMPDWRRRGVGRALFRRAVDVAIAAGRRRMAGNTVEPIGDGSSNRPAGSAFAVAMGARPALREVRYRLDLAERSDETLGQLVDEARRHAAGYSLIQWRDRVPEEYLVDVARLGSRLTSDAPHGDLPVPTDEIDPAALRGNEAARAAMACRLYATAARNEATGRLAALSTLVLESGTPRHAWQGVTVVDRADRGHRLGLLVKAENLRHANQGEAGLAAVHTWNAESNTHMVAINAAMGFRPVDVSVAWQRDL